MPDDITIQTPSGVTVSITGSQDGSKKKIPEIPGVQRGSEVTKKETRRELARRGAQSQPEVPNARFNMPKGSSLEISSFQIPVEELTINDVFYKHGHREMEVLLNSLKQIASNSNFDTEDYKSDFSYHSFAENLRKLTTELEEIQTYTSDIDEEMENTINGQASDEIKEALNFLYGSDSISLITTENHGFDRGLKIAFTNLRNYLQSTVNYQAPNWEPMPW